MRPKLKKPTTHKTRKKMITLYKLKGPLVISYLQKDEWQQIKLFREQLLLLNQISKFSHKSGIREISSFQFRSIIEMTPEEYHEERRTHI